MLSLYTVSPKDYFGSNCYLLESEGDFAVIDPSIKYEEALRLHPEISGRLKLVLLTHCHFDHILYIKEWVDAGGKVYIGRQDGKGLSDPNINCYQGFMGTLDGYFGDYTPISEGDSITLGDETIKVIDAPGHTAGGVIYETDIGLFVGDTVFAGGGYGRTDLPGGDIDTLERTLVKLFSREDDAVIYPGHGEPTTLSKNVKYFM